MVLKSQANAAATDYGKALEAHFVTILADQTRPGRIEKSKNIVHLKPVFMGQALSPKYKQAHEVVRPTYEDFISLGAKLIAESHAYDRTTKDIIEDIAKAEERANTGTGSSGKSLSEQKEAELSSSLKIAKDLGAVIDKVEKIKIIESYTGRDLLTSALKRMIVVRENSVQAYVDMQGPSREWKTPELQAAQKKSPVDTKNSGFDSAWFVPDLTSYNAKTANLQTEYTAAATDAFSAINSIISQLEKDPLKADLSNRLKKFNVESKAFRGEVKTFVKH